MFGSRWNVMVIIIMMISSSFLLFDTSKGEEDQLVSPSGSNIFFAGGNGTVSNPYQISNVSQLQNMNANLTAHYILIDDIDASDTILWNGGKAFKPIGGEMKRFSGSLEGQGHYIANLFVYRPSESYVGLFGSLDMGAILGNISMIENNMCGLNGVGGLVGFSRGTLTQCYSTGTVSGVDEVGGLVGNTSGAMLIQCYTTSVVIGKENVGGFVGNSSKAMLTQCYSTGTVSGLKNIGGLVGSSHEDTVFSCFWDTETSGISNSESGIRKNTSEMKNWNTFNSAGWDLSSVWGIIDGATYPYLKALDYGFPTIITENIVTAYEDTFYYIDYNATSRLPGGIGAFWNLTTDTGDWLTIQEDGVLSGTPLNDDVGTCWVNVSATSNGEGISLSNFTLTVYNTNDLPFIITDFLPDAIEGELYSFTIEGLDIDPVVDILTWTIETDAGFLYMDPTTGNLTGLPTNDDVGTRWVDVSVSDGNGGMGQRNFTLILVNVNDAPYNVSIIAGSSYFEGEDQLADSMAFDIDSDSLTYYWSSNISGEIGFGRSIYLSLPPGHHLITLIASDDGGLSSFVTKEIEIVKEEVPIEIEEIPDEKESDEPIPLLPFILLILASITVVATFYTAMRWKRIGRLPEE